MSSPLRPPAQSLLHPLPLLLATLRGSSEVIFLANPLAGALNFLAILWAAMAGGNGAIAIGAALGCLVATLAALAAGADRQRLSNGLYGFNGLLVGIALPTFLAPGPLFWLVLPLAAALSTFVTLAIEALLRPWALPAITFPFVLTSWIVLAAAPRLAGLTARSAPLPPASLSSFGAGDFLHGSLASVSQVFLLDNPLSGALFLLALLLASRWCAALAALGAIVAVLFALLLGADRGEILHGLWGYSAVLTAPAIGCIFQTPGVRALLLALVATLLTVLLQAALPAVLAPLGLPALTFPFVVATWLFLFAAGALNRPESRPELPRKTH